jgi:hypothetical protein
MFGDDCIRVFDSGVYDIFKRDMVKVTVREGWKECVAEARNL